MLAFPTDIWLGKDPFLTPYGWNREFVTEGIVGIGGVGRNESGEVVTLKKGFV